MTPGSFVVLLHAVLTLSGIAGAISCTGEYCVCPSTTACTLDCIGDNSCNDAELDCALAEQCTVTCDGDKACLNARIKGGAASVFELSCGGSQVGSQTCSGARVNCEDSGQCQVTCSGTSACSQMTLEGDDAGQVAINCTGSVSCTNTDLQCDSARASCGATCVDDCPLSVTNAVDNSAAVSFSCQSASPPQGQPHCSGTVVNCGGSQQCSLDCDFDCQPDFFCAQSSSCVTSPNWLTKNPTTPRPTRNPTTRRPTRNPTTENPTTPQPTRNPTTRSPTANPTSKNPTTPQPTGNPTTLTATNDPPPTANPTASPPTSANPPSAGPTAGLCERLELEADSGSAAAFSVYVRSCTPNYNLVEEDDGDSGYENVFDLPPYGDGDGDGDDDEDEDEEGRGVQLGPGVDIEFGSSQPTPPPSPSPASPPTPPAPPTPPTPPTSSPSPTSIVFNLPYDPRAEEYARRVLKDKSKRCLVGRLRCEWQDPESGLWSSSGCTLVNANEGTAKCSCNHLTVFSIIMRAETDPSAMCQMSTQDYVAGALYLILDVISLVQVSRLLGAWRAQRGPKRNSKGSNPYAAPALHHCIVLAVCAVRILYLAFKPTLSPSLLMLLGMVPSFLSLCLFLFIVMMWASLASTVLARDPLKGIRRIYIVGVLLLLACALVTPLTMALVSEEKHSLVASVGSYLMAAISGAMCLLTLISGTKLAVKLNGNFDGSKGSRKGSSNKSHSKGSSSGMMARRINVSAKVWALSFLCQATLYALSVGRAVTQSDTTSSVVESLFYFADIASLAVLLVILSAAVDRLSRVAKKKEAEANKTGRPPREFVRQKSSKPSISAGKPTPNSNRHPSDLELERVNSFDKPNKDLNSSAAV